MQSLGRTASVFAALGVALFLVAAHASDVHDPLEGTWILHVEKSNFGQTPPFKGQMRTYSDSGGLETMHARGMNSEGNPTKASYQARYDGKDYSIVGSKGGDTISLRRIDALTTQSTEKRDGKVTVSAVRHVSPDGKTLTVETKGTLPSGQVLDTTMVFERR